MNSTVDPRRADKVVRFKPSEASAGSGQGAGDDLMPDYMNILGWIFISHNCPNFSANSRLNRDLQE